MSRCLASSALPRPNEGVEEFGSISAAEFFGLVVEPDGVVGAWFETHPAPFPSNLEVLIRDVRESQEILERRQANSREATKQHDGEREV